MLYIKDKDDYFFIVDRKKDMIIASGYNVYPREIDEVLYQDPKIQDAVSIGCGKNPSKKPPYRGGSKKKKSGV